jgi:hypothetical protein
MRWLLITAFSLYALSAIANCELLSEGYHTIATYGEDDTVKDKRFIFYDFMDPYFYFRAIPKKNSKTPVKLPSNLAFDLVYDNKVCLEGVKTEVVDYFIRTPACKDVVLNDRFHHKAFAVLDVNKGKIHFPAYMKGKPVSTITEREKKINELIEAYLKKSDFLASKKQIIPSEKMKVFKIDHFYFNDKFSSSTVEIEGEGKGTFFVVFLIANDELWYIADSSGLMKCGEEPNLEIDRKKMNAYVEEGWDFNGDDIPDLIRFKKFDIYYYIEFGKEMIVLKDMTDRTVMRHNQDHGLKPKK